MPKFAAMKRHAAQRNDRDLEIGLILKAWTIVLVIEIQR
jgi:hypothetical protein